jgi:hypothetical protein
MSEEEQLRRAIEEHLENAEEYIRQGQRARAFLEFEEAAGKLERVQNTDQLEQLWGHAATGFTAAKAPLEAGNSFLRVAELEAQADRNADARDSYLAAANSFISVRDKNQDLWVSITQAVEKAINLSIALDENALAIELLFKNATIHRRETGFTFDAIDSLERAQRLLEKEPNHPLAEDVQDLLQKLVDRQL